MTYYIGTPNLDANKYFYQLRRDEDGYLTFTKVNLNTDTDSITELNDLDFEYADGTVVINIDENHELLNDEAGHVQYKFKTNDVLYFINDDGELVLRINGEYDYPSNV